MRRSAPIALAYVAGLVFGVGLAVSGMTRPSKVIGFLDFTGGMGPWDPSLALVMCAALVVTAIGYRFTLARPRPILGGGFALPEKTAVDARLVLGALIFGIGWGLSGVCPGPALVLVATFGRSALTFAVAMVAGMLLFDALPRPENSAKTPPNAALKTPGPMPTGRPGDG